MPNDETALRLMNASASLTMEQFPDIIFGYGFSNEYRYDIPLQNSYFCMERTTKKTDKIKNMCLGIAQFSLFS
jgi:tRNA(His) 5'-end guanylyltransferase